MKGAPRKRARPADVEALVAIASRPALATLAKAVAEPSAYLYELKYDGYRILAVKIGDEVRLVSRRGEDWTKSFAVVADAVRSLPVRAAVLDGEVCATDEHGVPRFNRLQKWQSDARVRASLTYVVFDVLWIEGRDVRSEPLERRKELARAAVGDIPEGARVTFSAAADEAPETVLRVACERGFEGAIAKRRGSTYEAGRTTAWLKLKCQLRQEFAIVGYLPYRGGEDAVGSLLLALRGADGHYRFTGKVGTGFTQRVRVALAKRLDARRSARATALGAPRFGGIARWSTPALVAEVAFTEWTESNIRHPTFLGLREDKAPEECIRETSSDGAARAATSEAPVVAGIAISHPERLVFSAPRTTKGELARYLESVGEWMLPHTRGRPLTLVRVEAAGRAEQGGTFMRHGKAWGPAALRRVRIPEKTKIGEYLVADTVSALVALAQMDVVEIHTWNTSIHEHVESPNRIVFDLDPSPEVSWADVVAAAFRVRRALEDCGLESWVKTTGGKGLHVVVPILPIVDWSRCLEFARSLAAALVHADPGRWTMALPKAQRRGRIFLDYLRNNRTNTSVAALSPRARPGAPVSVPITWRELTPSLDPRSFTLETVPKRLARLKKDPWAGYWRETQDLESALRDTATRTAGASRERTGDALRSSLAR